VRHEIADSTPSSIKNSHALCDGDKMFVACKLCKIQDCPTCAKPCNSSKWCNACKTWTSGDHEIDAIIIDNIRNHNKILTSPIQWIDPRRITDVRHLADGGFGTVDVATWLDNPYKAIDSVVLKTIKGEKIMAQFLNEVVL
jgi:hypothetical protein